jgi:hypothetical protein
VKKGAMILAAALLAGAIGGLLSTSGARAGSTAAPTFGKSIVLRGAQGGEPSIAVDTTSTKSRGDIYVGAIGDANGPTEWHSYNGGSTWSKPVPFDLNGPARGGDEDLVVNTNGNLIATDLNVSHASVQVSTDQGKTFSDGTITAPEDDRPWLTADGNNVYVAYHDFVAEEPTVCTSIDGGQTFATCVPAYNSDPGSQSACAENTVPARALSIDPKTKSLNFLYSCSTAAENAAHPPYGPLHDYYLAQSTDGGVTWTTYPVFLANTSKGKQPNYANIFGTLAIDSKGNYYALFDGTKDDANADKNTYHVLLAVSKNHGKTWSKPIRVDHDFNGRGTHELADLAVTTPGNVDVVWYGTKRSGEPNGVCGTIASQSPCTNSKGKKDGFPAYTSKKAPKWRVYMAQSLNALAAHPTFREVVVDTKPTHYGRLCSNGIVCGSSDRSLLDFISVGIDCGGYAHVTYGGNTKKQEKKGQTWIHVSNQTGGQRLAAPASCSKKK